MLKKIFSVAAVSVLLFAVAAGQTANAGKETSAVEKKPLSYGLAVDNSGSYRTIFETVIGAANQIFEAHDSDDTAFLTRFIDSDTMSLLQDFTASKAELQAATEDMFIEGGQTAILDGVLFSAKHLVEFSPPNRRRALIVITDGEDRKSAAKIEEVLKFLKTEKIQVYTLGLSDEKIYKSLLEKLAKETGGKSFMVEKRADIKNIIKELTAALHAG